MNSPLLKKLSEDKQNEIKEIMLKINLKELNLVSKILMKMPMKTKNLFDSEKCIKKYPNFFKK